MKKKVLFIDRDGTIIIEPPIDKQVDSLEKLEFLPKAISAIRELVLKTDYELVMVTNQDGLGTSSFPEDTFWPAHNKMLSVLSGEGIIFSNIHIDRSFEHEKLPTRKPGTAMLKEYFSEEYDLANSYVIGDRLTDVQLAKNMGTKSILIADQQNGDATFTSNDWAAIADFLINKHKQRKAFLRRKTKETDVEIELDLDGTGKTDISTGLHFFDHMLEQLGRHSGADLCIKVVGDLHIDEHHTIEDTGLALGEAFLKALGDKMGIERYGFLLPMDDALAQVAIDFSGRSWLVWNAEFKREKVGDMPTEMFYHFFKSFSDTAKCNLNISVSGDNEHHKIEAIFKALAKSIKMAIRKDQFNPYQLPSTKGVL